ncbi:diacylglycerol kinase alpha [Trichinella spiralis]|uniref:diacylglycerol kinase alpha n=1 Tax=Trichinella spiralis TaxID=6334 RepID=UPI0001EFC4AB|nr:diacylglycerol kinase alpha [Trichinella spiralis]
MNFIKYCLSSDRGSLAASTVSNVACTPSSRRSSFTLSENKLNIHDYIQRKCRNQEHESRLFFLGLANDQSETSTCQCSTVVRLKDIDCYFSLLENGTPEEKLEYTFHLYDADGNGYLDSNEIECIIEQMMSVAEHLAWDTVELKPILRDMLLEIDYDADGTVSLEEWKRGGLTTVPLLVLLGIDSIHQRCLNDWDVKCNLGKLAHHILPPTSLVPLVLVCNLQNYSAKLTPVFNKIFCYRLSADDQVQKVSKWDKTVQPIMVLFHLLCPLSRSIFLQTPNLCLYCLIRKAVVNKEQNQINYGDNRPPVAVLPLGTGNDLSRCLNWGGGFAGKTGNDLIAFLKSIEKSRVVTLDRWETNLIENDDSEKGDAMPNNIITNYFSVGVQSVCYVMSMFYFFDQFEMIFFIRMKNKLWYFEFATSESLQATCKNLHEYVEIQCDGSPLNLNSGPPLEGIAFLNIPSIYGGSNLWGRNANAAKSKRFWGIGSLGMRPNSESLTNSCHLIGNNQDMGDKKIEVVGIQSVISMGQVKAGLRTSAKRLAQCSSAIINVKINWICDAENGYALKALLYAGRSSEERQIDLASTKVGQLAQPFVNSNRNVFMDRYFTLYSTVQRLFEHGHTAIGTVFAHRCDVLACLRKAARHDPYSTLAVYEHNKKITMINYVPRKNSSVLLLT